MKFIDNILDSLTMYRLVLYYLIVLLSAAVMLSLVGMLPYSPISLIFSTLFLVAVCWITNKIFAYTFNAPTNIESVFISALILALILSPIKSFSGLPLLFWAAVLSMASKYILAINQKHIFNPVAVAVALTAFGFDGSPSWWIGTMSMLPFSLLGIVIVRKVRAYNLVLCFLLVSCIAMLGISFLQGSNVLTTLKQIISSSPIFFFAFIMLTEPLTTPPTKKLQSLYAVLVGLLFAPQFHIGSFNTTPETALVIGNIFSYLVSPKWKIISTMQQKIHIAPTMLELLFNPNKKLAFSPGQYMEWTLPHKNPDSRGNRRYFTIASSPTEDALRLGVKLNLNGSSYKRAMAAMHTNTLLVGTQLAGDFILPKDTKQKLVFIAGGIGVTPFRSMIKYLVDLQQQRPIVLFYANKTVDEIVYGDVFNQAQAELGIKIVYTLTDESKIPTGWQGKVGRVDADMIVQEVPDFMERKFYLSGPHAMVGAYEEVIRNMGVSNDNIKIDFFPGFV